MLALWEYFWLTSDWTPTPPPVVTAREPQVRLERLTRSDRMTRLENPNYPVPYPVDRPQSPSCPV